MMSPKKTIASLCAGATIDLRTTERFVAFVGKKNMILNEDFSGHTVKVVKGAVLTIQLRENPTTGYRWIVERSSGLTFVCDHFHQGSKSIGAFGMREIQFRAAAAGFHDLCLTNRREWESEGSAVGRFALKIEVSG